MNKPVFPWPFPASPKLSEPKPVQKDATVDMEPIDEADESPFCSCDLELTQQEVDTGKCASCGKKVFA